MEAMIPIEIGEHSWRVLNYDKENIEDNIRSELDLAEERKEVACIREALLKRRLDAQYNRHVSSRSFSEWDLVLRRANLVEKC